VDGWGLHNYWYPLSKIYLKYNPINILIYWHPRMTRSIQLSSYDFLFHTSLKMRKHKDQIPLVIHHNE